jgi:hypothetical protein
MITKENENCFSAPYSSDPGLPDHLVISTKLDIKKTWNFQKAYQSEKS